MTAMATTTITTTTTTTTTTSSQFIPVFKARGPVMGTLSGGRGILLTPVLCTAPALETLGTLTAGSTKGLDDVTLAEIGRVVLDADDTSIHNIHC